MRSPRLVLLLALAATCLLLASSSTNADARQQDDPTESAPAGEVEAEAGDGAGDDGAELSNSTTFLIGAVLLSGGIWAYMNRAKRYPGTRFRDPR